MRRRIISVGVSYIDLHISSMGTIWLNKEYHIQDNWFIWINNLVLL